MINITLICAGGMSTSMLMQKMQESAKAKNIEVEIIAMAESKFKSYQGKTDVLLLGPQVKYLLDDFKKTYEPTGMKVNSIEMMDYGMMNGEKVLATALDMLK